MKIIINYFKWITARSLSVMKLSDKNMEDIIKKIFYASVDSVKPCELISKNKLIRICDENNRELLVIKHEGGLSKYDVTDKRIQLGQFK